MLGTTSQLLLAKENTEMYNNELRNKKEKAKNALAANPDDSKSLAILAKPYKEFNPVTFITGIKYSSNIMKVYNNMTFLYDPNWEYEAGNPTYPISFFYVKSMSEVMDSEISEKPMLFYDSSSDTTDGTKGSILNIIADNIVIKPKTYKLDIIIPANGTTVQNGVNCFDTTSLLSFSTENSSASATDIAQAQGQLYLANLSKNIILDLLKVLYTPNISVSSACNLLLNQQDYNKASLEYMWRNRRLLKLKVWNGWNFKYLVIKNLEITKNGEDGDYYMGSLTCQEMPIMTFRKQALTSLGIMSTISSKLGTVQKTAVDTFITAMTASTGA